MTSDPGHQQGPHMDPAAPSGPAVPAPAARGSARGWVIPTAVALVLGLGVGIGIGIASTSGERADLKERNRGLNAQSAALTEQLKAAEDKQKTTQAELTAANTSLAVCRESGAAAQALVETAGQLAIASEEFELAEIDSPAEREAERKLTALSSQLQQNIGVAKDKSASCAGPGGTRS